MGKKRKTTCGHFGGTTAVGIPCKYKAGRGTDHPGEGACKDHNGSKEVLAFSVYVVQKPQNWDKAINAAYLWLVSGEIKSSAKDAGVGYRTLQHWVKSPWWYDACEEATDRWLSALKGEARRTLFDAVQEGDSKRAMEVLERTDKRLAPPTQRHELKVDYLHKDEVVRLMRLVGSGVSEVLHDWDGVVVVEEKMSVEIVKRIRVVMEPLLREVSSIPEGE